MSGGVPGQKQHIDALVLAFQYSKASALVGTDALRMVISGQYRDMLEGDILKLDALWGLLESQPGFSPELVIPPLCRFKSWEADLAVEVQLPPAISELSGLEVRGQADKIVVPEKELDKVLERGRFTEVERQQRASRWADGAADEIAPAPVTTKQSRPVVLALVSLIAVAGFAVAGFFVFQSLQAADWQTIDRASFSDVLPAAKAERHGQDVGVVLRDDRWLALGKETRKKNLREALTRLGRDGVKTLFVRDVKGAVRGIAQFYGNPPKISVRLRD